MKDMSLVLFTFNKVTLKVVTVNGTKWCKAKYVWKALKYQKKLVMLCEGIVL